jgi:hypothetical protein|tara:strand:+ start:534 stop:854 length:321 start_codon:yes stop_codon:yes gene_type:complete
MSTWSYEKNKDGFMGSENRIIKKEDKPEEGKVYALTGARGTSCIANGNSWKESEVHGEYAVTIDWGQEKQERKTYTFATAAEKDAFIRGVEEMDGWLEYSVVGENQ